MTAYDIVIRPIITERAMAGAADKKYVFEVAKSAGKVEIKKAVEEIFGVKVASVNTLNVPAKATRMGAGRPGTTRAWKARKSARAPLPQAAAPAGRRRWSS